MTGEQLALDLCVVDPGPLRAIEAGYVEDLAAGLAGEERCAKCGRPS